MSSILVLILLVAGACAKPLNETSDSPSKIKQGELTEVEIIDEGSIVTSTLKDVTQSINKPLQTLNNFQSDTATTSKPSLLTWFITPLAQNLQLNPQTIQNRVTQLKQALKSLGFRNYDSTSKAKQLSSANNLLQIADVNDSGFFTNRLEPAGFFGGNGWLANKGGILGGPGAILSTGSILTDYPTAYRRK
ncbi:PREDICTED: uncharacterized protein LOC108552881 [Eufriesea mexicana]|uniref:uncharacterized protein LOC108552881 n=1 Tax=Eufriesea mexicana TaxID=516756 RepID=UPI00083C37C6|nr:PREDICTED: uncharacterized protein LOC108552881 [Eufriesea mexicana]